MIHIDRNRHDEYGQLIEPSEGWYRRAELATEAAKQAVKQGRKPPENKMYSDYEIRTLLQKIFHEKCAYCEIKLVRTDWDVDHFRPKGRVKEEGPNNNTGYYWLAFKWTNLYPSCKYCNQGRKDNPKSKALGKLDQFPLEQGSPRATESDYDTKLERQLLIDPCQDNPEDYITFSPVDGKPIAIEDSSGIPSPKGLKSIEVFHLNQPQTNDERKEKISLYLKIWELLVSAIESSIKYPEDRSFKDQVKSSLELLESMTTDEAEYAAAKRSIKKRPTDYGIPLAQAKLFDLLD